MQTGGLDGGHLGVTQLRQVGNGCRAKREGFKAYRGCGHAGIIDAQGRRSGLLRHLARVG
jgi:hypothetical protein